MSKLIRFASLSFADQRLLLQAWLWLGVWRLLILLFPFKKLMPAPSAPADGASAFLHPAQSAIAGRLGWAVEAAGRHTPWRSTCLVQALACRAMLRRRGISSTLFIGVRQAEAASLKAHAWLQCDGRILIGASGHRAYRVLSAFT